MDRVHLTVPEPTVVIKVELAGKASFVYSSTDEGQWKTTH